MLSLCMILTILPTRSAAVDDLTNGDPDLKSAGNPVSLDLVGGDIIFTESGYTQGTSTTETAYTGTYAITQTGGTSTANTITVESGTVNMTISGLDVEADTGPAIWVKGGATLNLTLADGSTSTLVGAEGWSAISVDPGVYGQNGYEPDTQSTLIVKGAGTLYAYGGPATETFDRRRRVR